jgi:hypothetical protein
MDSERASQQAFFGVSDLFFAGSAALTNVWCASMSATGEMPVPGGWTMSMVWMPGWTWPGAAASFLVLIPVSFHLSRSSQGVLERQEALASAALPLIRSSTLKSAAISLSS